jgi:hypothetical protein
MTQAIGVEVDCPFTPGMLRKVAYAGSQSASFVEATKDLLTLAEVEVSRERVQRWTKRVGHERVAEALALAQSYGRLPLPEQRKSPGDQVPPVACVQMDGGRIQIRDRREALGDKESKGYWRETLVGCCLSMTSSEHSIDPCPTIPGTFVDPARMGELGREIKGFSSSEEDLSEASGDVAAPRSGVPQVLVRSVVATRQGMDAFGGRLVAAAHARGFHAARRKAFVADGGASNWSVHKKHFSHYTPVLDFTHAVCYVFASAMAGRSFAEGWSEYCQWAQWLWEGATSTLIAAVAHRAQALGPPGEGDGETSPRRIVAEARQYLTNQQSRMKYAEYRKLGLPITSSHIESTIKQINRRMKGTEKFWSQGAEPLLQLVADHLSETSDLDRFWTRRPNQLPPRRSYQTAA